MTRILALALLCFCANGAAAADHLVILSPHRKSIQAEFIPVFREYYQKKFGTPITVDWLDQGGTSNAVKYLQGKISSTPAKVGVDVFWGGPSANFIDMVNMKLLEPYELSKEARAKLPKDVAGVPLSDKANLWHAANLSSFGIMFNKHALKLDKLPEPTQWSDLAKKEFFDHVILADPRNSGTNSTMMYIVIDALGWEKGWQTLSAAIGNSRRITPAASDPIHAVVAGDSATAMAVDSYALAQVWELGKDKIGFVLPSEQTIIDPDAVALVKGAKNVLQAQRFIDFMMMDEAQKLWILPKGTPGGPKEHNLARLAVNNEVYAVTAGRHLEVMNPFTIKKFMPFNAEKFGTVRRVFLDYIGATLLDTHKDLKEAHRVAKQRNLPEAAYQWLGKPLVTEAEMIEYAAKWDDGVFRNKMINGWSNQAREKYRRVARGEAPWNI